MKEKIAICISTFLKDDILMQTINSILDNYQDNWVILIADQNNIEDYSEEKRIFYGTACAKAHTVNPENDRIKVLALPYDCGLSYSRNKMVELADELGIKYCLISADSIQFTESMRQLNNVVNYLKYSKEFDIDLLGFGLEGRIGWEAWLDLKDAFVLDFIDKTIEGDFEYENEDTKNYIWKCEICRNFFLATTESLLKVKWDNNLKMKEHEDFFWRYKQTGYLVGWTDVCYGKYLGCKDNKYKKQRTRNMNICGQILKQKYNLKNWVKYINLDNTKKGKV